MPRNWQAWTREEYALVEEHYPQGGSRAAQKALTAAGYHRTIDQIGAAAHRRHLRTAIIYNKYPQNSMVDSAIIRAYQRLYQGDRGALKAMAERLGRPYGWCKWRAVQLGLVKPKPARLWSAEEDDILAEHAELGLAAVQRQLQKRGYRRAQSAILQRRERLALPAEHPDLLTASAVARLLGCDTKTVRRWIKQGLKARKRRLQTPTNAPGDPQNWAIHRQDLRAWLRDHPGGWDVRQVSDHYWIVELLAGGPKGDA